ncbi:MAG: pyrimidine reductase family protein [Actinobacteria bacterium]|nr:pyrimidine reductase family protein [Actinomycetota bacterium]
MDLQLASLPDIAAHYESDSQNWVRANMIISQDGHFVGPSDSSRDLTGESDLKLLLLLRALSDVVLVGANTARNENYRQPKARDEFAFLSRKPPRLAVVSSSLDFNLTTPLFNAGQEPTIVFNVGTTAPSAELLRIAHVIQLTADDASSFATNLIANLFELGLSRVTCEGGPSLLAQLLKADVIDEYDLTISPLTVGGTPQWADALPKTTDWVEAAGATSGDFEFKRLLRS